MCPAEHTKVPKTKGSTPASIPSGTVTFLFTDIEGSTELLKVLGEEYTALLATHRNILRQIFSRWGGYEVDTQGDAFFISFARATQAVSAAVEAQLSLARQPWPKGTKLLVRMGLHTGEPWNGDEGYVGLDIHRAARIAHAGYGGQVLLSETTVPLVIGELPEGVGMIDLGKHLLKDLPRPEHIHQLVIAGLPAEFPPLRSSGILAPGSITTFETDALPQFLKSEGELPENKPIFVGNQDELERLSGYLHKAFAGQGSVAFITGSPGSGKTALMNEFSWRMMQESPTLLIVKGTCDAYSGEGDPYLPFRDILSALTGDLETRWSAGVISKEQAKRLWKILPEVTGALLDQGIDLINRLVSATGLLARSQENGLVPADSLGRLQVLAQQSPGAHNSPMVDQAAIFGQYTQVLSVLSKHHPLLVILDDLQWMDTGSINLLFYLGRRLMGNQILLVGAYRGEEVVQGRAGGRHPLDELLAEFKRLYGDIWIELDKKEAHHEQEFVNAYLDAEPNRLSSSFRKALYAHTEGHPLFTIELLRNLQDQGDLIRDPEGKWVEKDGINWQVIPSKVEGIIEERVGRLDAGQREILSLASVEGESFTAQVISRIQNLDESDLLRILSQSLNRQHRLIVDRGVERVGENLLFIYGFRHNLFQRYLYDRLTMPERLLFHRSIAQTLETLYTDNLEKISPQLAHHFDLAGLAEKAVQYYTMAGRYAIRLSANHEAISHINRALSLLKSLPASSDRSAKELNLQLSLGPLITSVKGWAAKELEITYDRARELCTELTDETQLVRTLWLLAVYWLGRSDHRRTEDIMKQLNEAIDRSGDPQFKSTGVIDVHDFYQGRLLNFCEKIENMTLRYDADQQRKLAQSYGMAPMLTGQAYLADCLWLIGHPHKAKVAIQLASTWSKELNLPFSTCYYLGRACWLYAQLDDWAATKVHAEMLLQISHEHKFVIFGHAATFYLRWVNIMTGGGTRTEIEQLRQSMEAYSATGTILNRTSWLVLFAEACIKAGCFESGIDAATEAINLGEKTGELWVQAEAYRIRGELLAAQAGSIEDNEAVYTEAQDCFLDAIEIARDQAALSWQLRAITSLVKLSHSFGIVNEAQPALQNCYQAFSEGFDTPDLLEAARYL